MTKSKVDKYYETYDYNSRRPVQIELETLREDQQNRLMKSKTFCMIPWTHIHGFPTGEAYPCCLGEMQHPIGNMRTNTLEEIWNGDRFNELREGHKTGDYPDYCKSCDFLIDDPEVLVYTNYDRDLHKLHGTTFSLEDYRS